jgi:hypothetical protein
VFLIPRPAAVLLSISLDTVRSTRECDAVDSRETIYNRGRGLKPEGIIAFVPSHVPASLGAETNIDKALGS